MEDFKHKGPEHTEKFKAGRHRTYFFDVYSTRKGEYYLTVTESKKRADGKGYERHKIFLYKEDLNRFLEMLTQSVNHVKDRMPEYDYDEFARRQIEWESQRDTNKSSVVSDDNELEEMEVMQESGTKQGMEEDGAVHQNQPAIVYSQLSEKESVSDDASADVENISNSHANDSHSTEDLSW